MIQNIYLLENLEKMLSESLLGRGHIYVKGILGSTRLWRAIFPMFVRVIKTMSVSCYVGDMERYVSSTYEIEKKENG